MPEPLAKTRRESRRVVDASAIIVTLALLSLSSCTASTPPSLPTTKPPPTPATDLGKIRFAKITTSNASSVPLLMALDRLTHEGYALEMNTFADASTAAQALSNGQADLGDANPSSGWAAIAKGAAFRSITSEYENPFSIIATQGIKTCQDLQGKPFANGSTSGTNALLVSAYIKVNCPGTSPQYLTIADSQARVAALVGGQAVATPLEIADIVQVQSQAPGKLHPLVDLRQAFPNVEFVTLAVNQNYGAQHRDVVVALVRDIVQVNRAVKANPQMLYDAMVKYMKYTPDQARTIADAYLAANTWDANGGLNADSLEATLDFLSKNGKVPATVKPEDVADLSYLNDVLNDLGRK